MERDSAALQATTIGTKVKVRETNRIPQEIHGMAGIIQGRYGAPNYMAFDVLLETGMSNLFWQHELDETTGDLG
ncbi:hypothetical protein BH23ACT11_BH23ACT11_29260 [soil metagenome]